MTLNELAANLKNHATALKADTFALYLAMRDPRTPWYARLLTAGVIAFALSPIDLIPDFIPIFGYLDDLILLPLAIALVVKLIPPPVLSDCREQAKEHLQTQYPVNHLAGVVIVLVWVTFLGGGLWWGYQVLNEYAIVP